MTPQKFGAETDPLGSIGAASLAAKASYPHPLVLGPWSTLNFGEGGS